MAKSKRRWTLYAILLLVNLAVLGMYWAGRGGRRDRFVFTVDQGRMSGSVDGRSLGIDFNVSDIPAASRKGIRFHLAVGESFNLPTKALTRIENIAIYTPDGKELLFRHTSAELDPDIWNTGKSNAWRGSPGGGLTPSIPGAAVILKPPGVDLDSFRLEFDAVNAFALAVAPVYADDANKTQLVYRLYTITVHSNPEIDLSHRVQAAVKSAKKTRGFSRPVQFLRSISYELVDSFPYLLLAAVVFLAVQLILLTPLSALWARTGMRSKKRAWAVIGVLVALAAIALVIAMQHGIPSVLKWLGKYAWAVALGTLIVVPTILSAYRCLWRSHGCREVSRQEGDLRPLRRWGWRWLVIISIAAGTALLLYITSEMLDRIPHVHDSSVQLMHARMVAGGRFSVPISEVLAQGHFSFDWMMMKNGRWASLCPPGHTLLLALGVLINAPWAMPGLLSGLTLLLVYWTGARLSGRGVGLLAVWLMIISPFFQMMGSSYMNHTSAALYWSAALLLFVVAVRSKSFWAFFGLGLSQFMLFCTRPLSAVGLGTPVAVAAIAWAVAADRRRRITVLLGVIAGIIPGFLFLLAFNHGSTGNAFLSGIQATGHVKLAITLSAEGFAIAFHNVLLHILFLKRTLFGWPMFLSFAPIVALFLSGRARRWDWLLLMTCITNAVAYSLYARVAPAYGPRYYYETLPVLCLLSARGIWEVAVIGRCYLAKATCDQVSFQNQRHGWHAAIAVVVIALTGGAVNDFWLTKGLSRRRIHNLIPISISGLKNYRGVNRDLEIAVEEQDLHHAVVFMRQDGGNQFMNAFPLNSPFFDSDIVYARCLGSRADRRLMQSFPGRTAYLAVKTAAGWEVEPYPEEVPIPRLALGVKGSDRSMPQLRPNDGDRPEAAAVQIAETYQGWELVSAINSSSVCVRERIGERDNVIQLHPISENVPAILRWRGTLPLGEPEFSFEAGAPPEHKGANTQVQSWIGDVFLGQVHVGENGRGNWVDCRYDLSAYAGKEVEIELWVVATGWSFEHACISALRIE